MAAKTFTTGLAPDGNAPPFGADAPPFPRRGNFSCRLALGLMSTTKYHAAKISPFGGDVAAGDRRGAFPMWRPCRGSPSRAKLVPGLHIKGLSNKSPDRCRRRGFTVLPPTGGIINSLPLKGKRLTTFCASLTLLQNVFAVHRKAAIHNPRGQRPVKLTNPPAKGRSILRTFFHNLSTQSAAPAAPLFL